MDSLTFVYTYYENPGMLAEQYRLWSSYPFIFRRLIKVIIVDDASPTAPAVDVPRPVGLPDLSIYRARKDIKWHQDGARNLGAHVAPDGWLFLCDIDHTLPEESLVKLLRLGDEDCFYTFRRLKFDGRPMLDKLGAPKPALNIYAITRENYWKMGGYDEDLCGYYGTDGPVRRRLLKVAKHVHLDDCPIRVYSRSNLPDASTTAWERRGKDNEKALRKAVVTKRKRGRWGKITVLDFEWDKVF